MPPDVCEILVFICLILTEIHLVPTRRLITPAKNTLSFFYEVIDDMQKKECQWGEVGVRLVVEVMQILAKRNLKCSFVSK